MKKKTRGRDFLLAFLLSPHLILAGASCARDAGPYLVHVGALLTTEAGYTQHQLNVLGDPHLSQNEPPLFPPQSRSLLVHEPLSLPLDVSSFVAGAKEEIPQGADSQ